MNKLFFTFLIGCLCIGIDNVVAQEGIPEPPCVVYKTKHNYDKNVAIILSDDKKDIVSYPHPRDVYYNGYLCYPIKLARRFRLDHRGINANVAFLSMTYEEYSKLEEAPSKEEMMNMIIDKNPLKEMYVCKLYAPDSMLNELNKLVRKKFKDCKVIIKQ